MESFAVNRFNCTGYAGNHFEFRAWNLKNMLFTTSILQLHAKLYFDNGSLNNNRSSKQLFETGI
jgi:hypothetical protein